MLISTAAFTKLLTYAKLMPTDTPYSQKRIHKQLESAVELVRELLMIQPTKKSQFIHDVLGDFKFDIFNTCCFDDPWYAHNWWNDDPQNYIEFLVMSLRDLPSHIQAIGDDYEHHKMEIDKLALEEICDVSGDYYHGDLGPSFI